MRGVIAKVCRGCGAKTGTLLAIIALATLAGCSTTARPPKVSAAIGDYYYGRYEPAKQALLPEAQKKNENYVLNNLRLASVALADYDLRLAETALYTAYEVINSVNVNDPGRATGTVVLWEGMKIWKGEPFERAMANFYLGVLYYMKHDYNNARAAFENALFKLRDYGESGKTDKYREVESDFTIAYIMLGRCWGKLGEPQKAADIFNRIAQLRPDLRPLIEAESFGSANVLLIVDFGQGIEKRLGPDNSIMVMWPDPRTAPPIPRAVVQVDGRRVDMRGQDMPPLDLIALAHERRWQTMDTVRVVKSAAATGLAAGAAYSAYQGHRETAIGLAAASLLLKASATADLRHWEMLPRTTFIIPLQLPPGRHDVTVNVGQFSQTWRGIVAPPQDEATYYIRISPWNPATYSWPPPALGLAAEPEPPTTPPTPAPRREGPRP